MDSNFDVIIIGGGPAGGQAARNLSKMGHKVLLVDKHKSFADNNFSSAGMTLEPLSEFDLPSSIIGSYWYNFEIQCTKKKYSWQSKNAQGVVLNFEKLKNFLADECRKNNGDVLMGYKYQRKEVFEDGVQVYLQNVEDKSIYKPKAKIVIDATGPLRKVMYDHDEEQPQMMVGSGTEYEIKVSQEIYDKFKDKLVFFLGHKWAIKGYSWIFPMENRILKVGAGKTHIKSKDQEETDKTTKKITEKIIEEYLECADYELIDAHGGIVRYCSGLKDIFYKNRVVGVGDAISAINPRGGEGIRYAMQSANLASEFIHEFLTTGTANFEEYPKKWKKQKRLKWKLSEISAHRMYNRYTDAQVEHRVAFFHKNFSTEQMVQSLFNFKYNKPVLRFFQMLWLKFTYFLQNKTF